MLIHLDENLNPSSEHSLKSILRGLNYGDGAFETMVFQNDEVKDFNMHIKRLNNGLKNIEINTLENNHIAKIYQIIKSNIHSSRAKVKLYVIRKEGGTYLPYTPDRNIILEILPFETFQFKILSKIDFIENIRNQYSPISGFKTLSSLNYVIAGLEIKKRQLHDGIIKDVNGFISECLTSNIFWITNDQLYTPSLSTGCINGISRQKIISHFSVEEVLFRPDQLKDVQTIFTTNLASMHLIDNVKGFSFNTNHNLLKAIKDFLF